MKRVEADGNPEFEFNLGELMQLVSGSLAGKLKLSGKQIHAVLPSRQVIEEFCTGMVLGYDQDGGLAIIAIGSTCFQYISWADQKIKDRLGSGVVGYKIPDEE